MNGFVNLVAVDVETSGTNPFENEILSIALAPLSEEIVPLEIYVKHAHIKWSEYAKLNFGRFQEQWIRLGIPPKSACKQIEDYLQANYQDQPIILIGHNVGFDISFLRKLAFTAGREMIRGISHRSIDTHSILYYLHLRGLGPKEFTNSDGAFQYFDIPIIPTRRHTALGDAIATRDLFRKLLSLDTF
ncbi:3'-5' exonuclease [Hydrogenophaga sp.]|uniref:3'-5' exonuclease n=1 Tax=Hydrogenophaga sp. TaxID=1904254 RepID=UPI003F718249